MTKSDRNRVRASVWLGAPDWAIALDDEQPFEVLYVFEDVCYVFGLTPDENGGSALAYARLAGFEAEVFPRQKLSPWDWAGVRLEKTAAAGGGR